MGASDVLRPDPTQYYVTHSARIGIARCGPRISLGRAETDRHHGLLDLVGLCHLQFVWAEGTSVCCLLAAPTGVLRRWLGYQILPDGALPAGDARRSRSLDRDSPDSGVALPEAIHQWL